MNADGIRIHSKTEFDGMRKSCKLAARTLDMIGEFVAPGVSTDQLNQLCHDFIINNKELIIYHREISILERAVGMDRL